jgi:predicted SprT family Zn-dependent metalloprotease
MDLNDAKTLAHDLMATHGLDSLGWTFAFDNATRRMGLCQFTPRRISMSRHYASHADEKSVRNTILHEIAHAKAGPAAKHGPRWRAVAVSLGATPRACGENPYATRDAALQANLDAVAGKPFLRVRNAKFSDQRWRVLKDNDKSYLLVGEDGHTLRCAKELTYPDGEAAPTMREMREDVRQRNLAAVADEPVVRVTLSGYTVRRYSILRPGPKNFQLVDLATGESLRVPKRYVRAESTRERAVALTA